MQSTYIGKANSENCHDFIAAKVVKALNIPTSYTITDSLSGYFHNLTRVGAAAKVSLKMAKTIAIFGSFVSHQKTRAKTERKPQI